MRLLLPLVLALALVPACGGEEETIDDPAPAGDPAGDRAVVDISLSEFVAEPSEIAVEPGSYTFHVVNDGQVVHALEIEVPSGEVETGDLQPGESADLEVDLPEDGAFELYCPVGDHRNRGMEGTIVVGAGSVGTTTDQTTTEEESDYRY
jgi:uncharacterized cupredoxin-like copper-binding protein